jgi:NAD(P)-dependent dehydrogenase (short-subunit alcohol dehydrogenase family)
MGGAELLLFATKGTSIVIMDIDLPTAEERTDRINDEAGGHAIAIGADISCATEVDTAVYRATVELWPINMLFNHAGTIMIKPFLDTTEEEWDWLHAVNVKSMILVHLLHFGPLQHNQGHVPSVRLRDGGRVPRSQHTV